MKPTRPILLVVLIMASLAPVFALANGGDQRVVENKYLINLSRAPFTPRVGVKTSFLVSFVDIQKNKLIGENLMVNIRISKLGEAPRGNFIFEKNNIQVKGGVLDFPYTFVNAGLHEIFFDITFASNPAKIYNAPDFLIDVQNKESRSNINRFIVGSMVSGIIGVVLGFVFGIWFGQRKA